jgi:hypothetical protein
MELTNDEKKLIEAVRDLNDATYNILLWYSAGLEEAQAKAKQIPNNDYRVAMDQKLIDIANKHMRDWDNK